MNRFENACMYLMLCESKRNIQEAIAVDDATCTMPKIYVVLKCVNFENQAINVTSKITPQS
jgi:hypothetical protein